MIMSGDASTGLYYNIVSRAIMPEGDKNGAKNGGGPQWSVGAISSVSHNARPAVVSGAGAPSNDIQSLAHIPDSELCYVVWIMDMF
jgi:hypothetical protein